MQDALGASAFLEGAPSEAARLMFVGRMDVRTKGLDILVEAFARSQQRQDPDPRP